MFSGYNRLALVTGSEFVWNGETAIAGAAFHHTAARRTCSCRCTARHGARLCAGNPPSHFAPDLMRRGHWGIAS
jgi:hypothetical protein